MSEAAPLLAVLRRVRRRLRLWGVLEGAVIGTAAGSLLAAAIRVAFRLRGAPGPLTLPAVLVAGCVLVGVVWRLGRRIPLSRCARLADAALDREDRVLSALSFAAEPAPSPLVRALVADAAARVSRLSLAGAVSARRPRGLAALAVGTAALLLAGAFPVRSGAALPPAPILSARSAPPGAPLAPGALDLEKEEARRAAEAADALADPRVASLAAELERGLRDLAEGRLDDGRMLDLLKAIEAEAAAAARAAERDGHALEASQRALAADRATRAAAEALAARDGDSARAALGASAAEKPKETGRALAEAARGVAGTLGRSHQNDDTDGKQGDRRDEKRRLARERDDAPAPEGGEPGDRPDENERRLERLKRDLDETARSCQAGEPGCREDAERRGDELSRLARRAAAGESLRRLERTARQMRGRLGRGELRDPGETRALRQFERGASGDPGDRSGGRAAGERGESGEPGDELVAAEGEPGAGRSGDGNREGSEDGRGGSPQGKGRSGDGQAAAGDAARAVERTGRGTGTSGGEDGAGDQPGGDPLGRKSSTGSHGRSTEAEVASGAGPSRAEVIGGASSRGFVTPGYARVFADYEAAVEDALGAAAVPEGKRYIVRRYFDLIRPREGTQRAP